MEGSELDFTSFFVDEMREKVDKMSRECSREQVGRDS